jgi:hypothetical protein
VHDSDAVRGSDRRADFQIEPQTLVDVEPPLVAERVQPLAFDILHHEVRQTLRTRAAGEQSGDERVFERG